MPKSSDADDLAALRLTVASQDLPFGRGFDGNEVKLSDIFVDIRARGMAPRERAAFMGAKLKELTVSFGNDAWELDEPTGIENPARVLEAQWVLEWSKNDDGAPMAKARLALQVFNDPDALNGTAPTASRAASRLARQLATLLAANNGQGLWTSDVAAASLQGRPREREPCTKAPKGAAELAGIGPDALAKLTEPTRGLVGAPRRRWLRAVDDLQESGLKLRPPGPRAFLGLDKGGDGDAFILLRVNDMPGAGDRRPGSRSEQTMQDVNRRFKFRKWIEDDQMDVTQVPRWGHPSASGSEIEVNMATCANNLGPIAIDQTGGDSAIELTVSEKRQLR